MTTNDSARMADLKSAAGAHLKTVSIKKKKTFMSVPDFMHGYLDLHEHDETDMECAFENEGPTPLEKASCMAGMELEGPWDPSKTDVTGVYNVNSIGCCGGPAYCVQSFTIDAGDVIPAGDMKDHYVTCCGAPAHALSNGKVAMHIMLRKNKTVFRKTPLGYLMKRIAGDVVYVFTVAESGIVRFHLPPETGTLTKICFAYADSETVCGFFKNIKHAMTNGCFCLGMYYKEKAAEAAGPPKTVLMRFNRWKTDLTPYWAGIVKPKSSE